MVGRGPGIKLNGFARAQHVMVLHKVKLIKLYYLSFR